MKPTTKALLFSAFVCPGAGHIYLKKYLPGGILITVSLIAFLVIFVDAMTQVQVIVDQILSGQVSSDLQTIMQKVRSRPISTSVYIAYGALITSWVLGIVDSYRQAKRLNQA